MKKKIKVADLPDFDMTDYLHSDIDMVEYLSVVIEEGDASLLAAAMGDIAKACGKACKGGCTPHASLHHAALHA